MHAHAERGEASRATPIVCGIVLRVGEVLDAKHDAETVIELVCGGQSRERVRAELHALPTEPLRQNPLAAEDGRADRKRQALHRRDTYLRTRSEVRPEGQAFPYRKFGW